MKNELKTFAVLKDGIVENAIVGEALAIVRALLPDNEVIEVTDETGVAFIGSPFTNGVFVPLKPYESWTLDQSKTKWIAPKPEPTVDAGFFTEWNEEKLEWDIKEFPELFTPESE